MIVDVAGARDREDTPGTRGQRNIVAAIHGAEINIEILDLCRPVVPPPIQASEVSTPPPKRPAGLGVADGPYPRSGGKRAPNPTAWKVEVDLTPPPTPRRR